LLLFSAVLVLALAAAVVSVVGTNTVRPAFSNRAMLQQVTGLPVLGSLSRVAARLASPWYRRQGPLVGASLAMLLVVYLFNLWAVQLWVLDSLRRVGVVE
jgi:hypothetical protein